MKEEKICNNCRYYLAHYIKGQRGLRELCEGHCINDELYRKRNRSRYKLYDNCEYWEPIAIQKAERRKSIKQILRDMEKSLEDIKMILQSDEE